MVLVWRDRAADRIVRGMGCRQLSVHGRTRAVWSRTKLGSCSSQESNHCSLPRPDSKLPDSTRGAKPPRRTYSHRDISRFLDVRYPGVNKSGYPIRIHSVEPRSRSKLSSLFGDRCRSLLAGDSPSGIASKLAPTTESFGSVRRRGAERSPRPGTSFVPGRPANLSLSA